MPRTTRTQDPADPRMPRRTPQEAATPSPGADLERGARGARGRNTGTSRSAARTSGVARSDEQQATPAYDDIARRAYELYQERGGNEGQDLDDWLRAEAELRGRREDEL